jgi:hypothetical protein
VPASVRFRSGNPRGFALNAGLQRMAARAENGLFAGSFNPVRETSVLLAMQKVEGSNPFSRFEKGPANRTLSGTHGSLDLLSSRGPFEDRRRSAPAPDLEMGRFAGGFRSKRTVVILRPPQKATGSDRACCVTIERDL